jgi:hypothetical protein
MGVSPGKFSVSQDKFSELLASLKRSVPTIRRVPRGARLVVALALKDTIVAVTQDNSEQAWQSLLLFPFATLGIPRACDEAKDLTKWVKDRTSAWMNLLPT